MNSRQCRTALILSIAVAAALLVRCFSFSNFVNPDGGFYFYSIDSYDHLRRVSLGIISFPRIASFDFYAAFPKGLGQIWAPLFDYFLSAVCLVAGGSKEVIETICFFSGPFLAACAVIAVFFTARASFLSTPAALFASFVLALHPGNISYSIPMNFDHHAAEPLLVLMLFSLPFLARGRGGLSRMAISCWIGALLLSIFIWRGSSIYWTFAFVSAFGSCLSKDDRKQARSYGIVFSGAAFFLTIYCLYDPWGNAGQVSFGVVSWFHALMLLGWSGLFFFYSQCRSRKVFFIYIAGVSCILILLFAVGSLEGLVAQVRGGFSFLRGQGDPWLESNSELRGVFSSRYSFWFSLSYLTLFWAVAPVAVCVALGQWLRNKEKTLQLNFIVWSPLIMMGSVIRYTHVTGVFAALAAAFLFSLLWRWSDGRVSRRILLVVIGSALFLPGLPHYKNTIAGRLPDNMKFGLYGKDGVLEWIRQHTPVTSYYLKPTSVPEYGVLARWSMGARIYQLAARPSLSTAFGWETHGFYQEAGFWVAPQPQGAMRLLEENKIRYVVLKAGHDLQSDYALTHKAVEKGVLPKELLGSGKLVTERTMYYRLLSGDGGGMVTGSSFLPALERYRLVYESAFLASGGKGSSFYKIFEVVPGAVVSGMAPPGMPVSISLNLQTSRKRQMVYFDRIITAANGEFAFRLPYNTQELQGDTLPLGQYGLRVGGFAPQYFTVSEWQVKNGEIIELLLR